MLDKVAAERDGCIPGDIILGDERHSVCGMKTSKSQVLVLWTCRA